MEKSTNPSNLFMVLHSPLFTLDYSCPHIEDDGLDTLGGLLAKHGKGLRHFAIELDP